MKKTYSEKLQDPRWQKLRLKVFERDNFTCKLCGDNKETLHVHHEKYKGDPWDANINDLKTLCKDCHFLVTKVYDVNIKKVIKGGGMLFYSDGSGYGWICTDQLPPHGMYATREDMRVIFNFIKEANNG